MKKITLVVLISICFIVSTGCGYKDIDKRFFVIAMGIDRTENPKKPYRVTLKLGVPSPKTVPGESNTFQLLSEESDSITDAVRHIKSKVDKELDFGHTKVIIFGDDLAKKDIETPLDWFMRRRDIQKISYVGIGQPTAEAVLNTSPVSERLPANALILSFMQEGTESSFIVTETLADFYRRLTERGLDPYLPVIKAAKETFVIDQVAVLNKHRVVKILGKEGTRILNEAARNFQKFDIHTKAGDQAFSLSISTFKMKYKIVLSPKPYIQVNITMKAMAEESAQQLYDQNWEKIGKLAGAQSKKRFLKLFHTLQKLEVDPVGFGLRYRSMGHISDKEWKEWLALYPEIDFKVNVKVIMLSTGIVK